MNAGAIGYDRSILLVVYIYLHRPKQMVKKEKSLIFYHNYGAGVHWASDYAAKHPDVSLDILESQTLLPLDYDAIRSSITKTGKVLLLHEDTLIGGIGGEIAAWISEHCFELLDAPVLRCASLDTLFHSISSWKKILWQNQGWMNVCKS